MVAAGLRRTAALGCSGSTAGYPVTCPAGSTAGIGPGVGGEAIAGQNDCARRIRARVTRRAPTATAVWRLAVIRRRTDCEAVGRFRRTRDVDVIAEVHVVTV